MKDTFGEKVFYGINYVIIGLAALSCVLPLFHLLAMSLSSPSAVLSGRVSVYPIGFSLEAYEMLITRTRVIPAFMNSVQITVVGTALSMMATILAAYPLSRKYFFSRKFFTMLIVFTMIFSGGVIPTYLLVRAFGLVGTYGALWVSSLVSVFNLLIMKTFFENLPEEMMESARMDGCSEFRLLVSIVLPLSFATLAALTLFYGVSYWNNYMNVLIYINDSEKYNLTVLVQQMVQNMTEMDRLRAGAEIEEAAETVPGKTIQSAAIIVLLVPMLVVYPFLQKYFVKGIMLGAIKG